MNHSQQRKKRITTVWITALCCLLALAWVLTQTTPTADAQSRGLQQRRGSSESKIKVGEFTPDFELPILKFGKDREGGPVGIINEKETIRLSSFFGKRPVCMIMSSYT